MTEVTNYLMTIRTSYSFTLIFDGEHAFEDVLSSFIADKILTHFDKKGLPNTGEIRYNASRIPHQHVSGSCEEAS